MRRGYIEDILSIADWSKLLYLPRGGWDERGLMSSSLIETDTLRFFFLLSSQICWGLIAIEVVIGQRSFVCLT